MLPPRWFTPEYDLYATVRHPLLVRVGFWLSKDADWSRATLEARRPSIHGGVPRSLEMAVAEQYSKTIFTCGGRFLFQSSLREHLEELMLRPHVDRLCNELAAAVVNKAFGDSFDSE